MHHLVKIHSQKHAFPNTGVYIYVGKFVGTRFHLNPCSRTTYIYYVRWFRSSVSTNVTCELITCTFQGDVDSTEPHVHRNVSSYLPCRPRLVFGSHILRLGYLPLVPKVRHWNIIFIDKCIHLLPGSRVIDLFFLYKENLCNGNMLKRYVQTVVY